MGRQPGHHRLRDRHQHVPPARAPPLPGGAVNPRVAGIIGGVIGVVATGAAIGAAVRSKRRDVVEDMYADEPFGELPPTRTCTVAADDGIPLSVEEVDPD